jgi:hypothetical protein
MRKKRTTIYINPDLWIKFRMSCLLKNITPSKRIEELIKKEVGKWKMKKWS